MKIAFYAPLKSPDHPVPSGDRLMAQQLRQALKLAGYDVDVVSSFRAFAPTPEVPQQRQRDAERECQRIAADWRLQGAPDIWFCYHPYYKAPDLLGPELCRAFAVPYVTVETSYSSRRNIGDWQAAQDLLLAGIRQATVNICLTDRDRRGILDVVPQARVARLSPFIDPAAFLSQPPRPQPNRLVTVAMMRPGDKLESYRSLGHALSRLVDLDWILDIVGDGPARSEVEAALTGLPAERIRWLGQKDKPEIAAILATSSLYVWPGHGEAYGLAYLEAQAAGLPVIAFDVAGVPEVVEHGRTGLLVAAGDTDAYAAAIANSLRDTSQRERFAANARDFVKSERSMQMAARRLHEILTSALGEKS
jgi:glycosyltransferase involved in cell wall biosynthesis